MNESLYIPLPPLDPKTGFDGLEIYCSPMESQRLIEVVLGVNLGLSTNIELVIFILLLPLAIATVFFGRKLHNAPMEAGSMEQQKQNRLFYCILASHLIYITISILFVIRPGLHFGSC